MRIAGGQTLARLLCRRLEAKLHGFCSDQCPFRDHVFGVGVSAEKWELKNTEEALAQHLI